MSYYMGIDTSNYTTSVAIYDSEAKKIIQNKKLLPVKHGSIGLKQSDAVFSHIKQLSGVTKGCFDGKEIEISAFGASSKPRDEQGSYMPCFLVGETVADVIGTVTGKNVYKFSHQNGHIMAALYSSKKLDLIRNDFIAFHFSGGTTECVFVKPSEENVISPNMIAHSIDLKAGQAIDRVGRMLGIDFPAGSELDKLSLLSDKNYKIKPTFKDKNPCISGLENKCKDMFVKGENHEDIAKFCITYIKEVTKIMLLNERKQYGNLPVLMSGGVMSNTLIQKELKNITDVYTAAPEFSSDNASGIAILAAIKNGEHV